MKSNYSQKKTGVNTPVLTFFEEKNTYLLWISILIISLFIHVYRQENIFEYNRNLIEQGQYWLLITGNFVHLNYTHLIMNIVGLLFIAIVFNSYGTLWDWLSVVLFSSIVVGCLLFYFNPELVKYAGLSGIIHGLFMYGSLHEVRKYTVSGYVLLSVIVGKLLWEFFFGALFHSEFLIGAHVVVEAHLYGAIGGVIVYTFQAVIRLS